MTNSQKLGFASALAAALAVGAFGGRLSAQAPAPTVRLTGVRVLGPTSDAAHPYYYGATFLVQPFEAGTAPVAREVICNTDGNGPMLDGVPYTPAAAACASIIATGTDLATKVGVMASTILAPNVAPVSTDMAVAIVDSGP